MEIKEVRVSSKRTEHIKVGTTVDTFVSFETEYTATLDKEDNVKDATKELYDRANSQIDEQVEEFVNLCYGKDNESLEDSETDKKDNEENHKSHS